MNINDSFPSKYLKASDLGGRQVTVKIDRVEIEEVGRDQERRPVLYFIGKQKGVVLNKTNANKLASAYGQDTDEWADREVILFEAMVDYGGDTVPAIRMKIPSTSAYRSPSRQEPPAQERRPASNGTGNGHRQREPAMAEDDRGYEDRRETPPARTKTAAELDDDIPF